MDIVGRLKTFIEYTGLTSSQFADKALIPRPTLSQIMNGRNKKISNELITKLHLAFPELNVLWLMFGDGEMANNSLKRFSAPQTTDIFANIDAQKPDNEPASSSSGTLFSQQENESEKNRLVESGPYVPYNSVKNQQNRNSGLASQQGNAVYGTFETTKPRSVQGTFDASQLASSKLSAPHQSESNSGDKRINYVLVFFTDGTFQELRPNDD